MSFLTLAFALGYGEIFVILLILLLVFGAKRIPELARSLGRATREFKNGQDGLISELDKEAEAPKEAAQAADGKEGPAASEKKG